MKIRQKFLLSQMFLLLVLAVCLYSSGYIYSTAVGQKTYNNAIAIGLGNNSSLINSLFVMNTNPSVLVDNDRLVSEFNYGFYITDERIIEDKQPLAKNDYNFFLGPDLAIFYPIKLKNSSLKLGLGIGYFNEYEGNYSYKISTLTYSTLSNFDSLTTPIVFGTKKFSIGFGIKNFLGGGSLQDSLQKIEATYSGSGIILGSKLKIVNTIIGISFVPRNDINIKLKDPSAEHKISYPQKLTIALKQDFGVADMNPDCAFVEVTMLSYSEMKFNNLLLNYNDVTTLSLGLEKIFNEEFILRLGFFYEPSYIIRGCVKSGISMGVGYNKNNLQINIGVNYSKENYKGDGIIFSKKKVIDESYTNIVLGIKYKL